MLAPADSVCISQQCLLAAAATLNPKHQTSARGLGLLPFCTEHKYLAPVTLNPRPFRVYLRNPNTDCFNSFRSKLHTNARIIVLQSRACLGALG